MRNKNSDSIEKLVIPQRTQPPHIGHISMLEAACMNAKEVVIAIGSCNVTNKKNPYTAEERELMLRKSLEDVGVSNYSFIYVPDFNSNEDWVNYLKENAQMKKGSKVLSGNDYVELIFAQQGYETVRPEEIISHDLIDISATKLRKMIVDNDPEWQKYAASGTLHYFDKFGGKERISKFDENENETNRRYKTNETCLVYQSA